MPIPGRGSGKINSSLFYGGPALMVQTVENLAHVQIDYWAITTFWGFTDMIDSVGGLTMNVPFAMSDSYARADFQPGVQDLSGRDALAFARTRHDLQMGDFARQENGGRLFLAALANFQRAFRSDPSSLVEWLGAGMRNIETTMSLGEIMPLAFTASKHPRQERPERGVARWVRHGGVHVGRVARHGSGAGDLHRRRKGRHAAEEEHPTQPHRRANSSPPCLRWRP